MKQNYRTRLREKRKPKLQKYKRWFGLDGADSFFNWFSDNPDDYKNFIDGFKKELESNKRWGIWRSGDNWLMAEARRGLKAAKKGKMYRQRYRYEKLNLFE